MSIRTAHIHTQIISGNYVTGNGAGKSGSIIAVINFIGNREAHLKIKGIDLEIRPPVLNVVVGIVGIGQRSLPDDIRSCRQITGGTEFRRDQLQFTGKRFPRHHIQRSIGKYRNCITVSHVLHGICSYSN